MLKKSQRLSKSDIENFFKSRFRTYSFDGVFLRVGRNEEKILKFAFMVQSSVKRNAVARNLTRRRMSEIAMELNPKITNGLDLIFSLKLSQRRAPSFANLKNDIIKLLSLCGVL